VPVTASDRLRAVLAHVDADEVVELARALVRIPSITGREGRAVGEHAHAWFRDNGIESGLQEVAPERLNVWGRVGGESGPRLLLNGHLDTKPVEGMTIDPFAAELRDGRLWGRGACDMKSAVAAAMVAAKAVARSGVPLAGSLVVGSEVGEEGGGWTLLPLLEGPGRSDMMVCCEPTHLEVHLGCRGFFPLIVTTRGVATHTGMAHRGVNAIEKMSKLISALYTLPCFASADPVWGRSPVNAMQIAGGGKVTASVPDECTTWFDIRLNPGLEPDDLQAHVDDLLARLRAEDRQLEVEYRFRPIGNIPGVEVTNGLAATTLRPDEPLVTALLAAAAAATGRRPALGGFPGGCSAAVAARLGVPSAVFGPGDLEQAHSVDEWIEVEQVLAAARTYAALAVELLGAPG
jgi:succinyl-diaminopimelate desuccinylase